MVTGRILLFCLSLVPLSVAASELTDSINYYQYSALERCTWKWICSSNYKIGKDVTREMEWIAYKGHEEHVEKPFDEDLHLAILLGDQCPGKGKLLQRFCPGLNRSFDFHTVAPAHTTIESDIPIPSFQEEDLYFVNVDHRHLVETSSTGNHLKHARSSARNIELLDSNELVVTLMSTSKGKYWETRAVAAGKTWAKKFTNLFYVMEESENTRILFMRKGCHSSTEFKFHVYECQNEPRVVIVNCSGDYYGATGPCCKFDSAITYMIAATQPGMRFDRMKWWCFGDDDNYFHLPNFLQSLKLFDWKVPQYRSPLRGRQVPHLQKGMWHHNPQCEHLIEMRIAQPLVMSITAFNRLKFVPTSKGTQKICKDWDITHDWGCALLFWQLELSWGKYHMHGSVP